MKKQLFRVAALCSVFAAAALAGCGGTVPPGGSTTDDPPAAQLQAGAEGWYVLTEKTVQGVSVADGYLYNCIYLKDGAANWYEIDYSGKSEKRGEYTASGDTVRVEIGVKTYEFAFHGESETMTYSGKIDRRNVTMTYKYDGKFILPVAEGGTSFTDELFGESKDENFYNYCPTVMTEGNNVLHVWYCSNKTSANITDYVAYRKGTLNASGKWEFGEKQIVLEHGETDSWDGRHVCDPTVIKGAFSMNGEDYSYLMAFLGCKTSNNTCNEVGIAVAKSPEGPWEKVESLNPIANYYTSAEFDETKWGYGQPSLVSYDGEGKALLFYAKGTAKKTCTQVELWDLSNLDSPQKLESAEVREGNVVNAGGSTDCINNADFAYDPVNNRLYCIKEDFPYPTDSGINWIASTNVLMYVDLGEQGLDRLFGTEIYSWNKLDTLSAAAPYVRAHNAGIVTDAYGRLNDPFRVALLYTVSEAYTAYPDWVGYGSGQWPALHTYRIHGAVFDVK